MDSRELNLHFKTNNGNHYYLDELNKCFYYFHPVMAYLYHNAIEINDLQTFSYPINVDGIEYAYEDIWYYFQKIVFFREKGMIKSCNDSILYEEFLQKDIEESIANSDSVVLEMTENCNLKCVYCIYGELYNRTPLRAHNNLNSQFVIELITYFHKHYWNTEKNHSLKKSIRISFYGGEPLLRFNDIKRIVEHTQKLITDKVNFEYLMTTNGLLINEDIAIFFAKYNFQVSISIDGDEYANSYRVYPNGLPSYNNLIKNIEFLQKRYSKYFAENVFFMSVLHNRNSVEVINHFFRDKFNKFVSFGTLNPIGVLSNKVQEFNQMINSDNVNDDNSHRYQKELNTIIGCYHPYINSSIYDILLKRTLKRFPTGTCMPLNKKIFISAQNLLLPCEKIDFRFNYGNLEDVNNIEELIGKVAQKHSSYLNSISKNCRMCFINNICDKCIFNLIESKKEHSDKNKRCKYFCTKSGFQDKMGYYIGTIEREPTKLNEVLSYYKKL